MNTLSDKAVLSTKECATFCGSEAIFEELEAIYGTTLLKPLRTLSNNSRTWSKTVVLGVLNKAQSEGVLNDRCLVEKALENLRTKKRSAPANMLGGRVESWQNHTNQPTQLSK